MKCVHGSDFLVVFKRASQSVKQLTAANRTSLFRMCVCSSGSNVMMLIDWGGGVVCLFGFLGGLLFLTKMFYFECWYSK